MKTILTEMGRSRPEFLKYDAASMVDTSIVKAIDDEGFLRKLKWRNHRKRDRPKERGHSCPRRGLENPRSF